MESPFIYDRYVTGKHFVGRKDSCAILGNLLSNGEHVCIYSPPKTGKTPKTGDQSNIGLWVAVLAVSGGAAATAVVLYKRKRKQ